MWIPYMMSLRKCCGCASMYRRSVLSLRYQEVATRLGVQHHCCSQCVSRVACRLRVRVLVRLSHPRPPDRNQHGCTVGVLPGPTRVLPMPGSMASVAEGQLVLC